MLLTQRAGRVIEPTVSTHPIGGVDDGLLLCGGDIVDRRIDQPCTATFNSRTLCGRISDVRMRRFPGIATRFRLLRIGRFPFLRRHTCLLRMGFVPGNLARAARARMFFAPLAFGLTHLLAMVKTLLACFGANFCTVSGTGYRRFLTLVGPRFRAFFWRHRPLAFLLFCADIRATFFKVCVISPAIPRVSVRIGRLALFWRHGRTLLASTCFLLGRQRSVIACTVAGIAGIFAGLTFFRRSERNTFWHDPISVMGSGLSVQQPAGNGLSACRA